MIHKLLFVIGCTSGSIRLVGTGSSSTQGRVEVCNNNQWGTVCDDTWNSLDASVACLHLGYSNEGILIILGIHDQEDTVARVWWGVCVSVCACLCMCHWTKIWISYMYENL